MNTSYDHPETLTPVASLVQSTMTAGLLLFVPLVALSWFIVTSILAAIGVPVAWLFGIVLGGGLSAALYAARTRKLEAEVGAMTLETRNGVDTTTGEPLVALYPQQFDAAWPDGRIGEWVRHHRPDVFAEAIAIWDQRARGSSRGVRA